MALIITWDAVPSSGIDGIYVVKHARGGYGAVRDVDLEVPGRDGSWHFEERRGLRDITADVVLVADSPSVRHAHAVELADWLDKLGRRKLIFSDQPDRYWNAALVSDIAPDEWRRLTKAQIQWRAEPYAYAIATSEVCFTAASGADVDSFTADDAIEAYPEITFVPTGGSLTSVSLTMNGDTITWSGTVGSGSYLTISSISATVLLGQSGDTELTGAFDVSALNMANVTGDFPLVIPGTNTYTLNTTGSFSNLEMCIVWRRRYR